MKSTKFNEVHDYFYDQKFGDIERDDTLGLINRMTGLDINDKGNVFFHSQRNHPSKKKINKMLKR